MPKAKELTVAIPDRPGALAKCLNALAEQKVNILAFQSYVEEGESRARFYVDDIAAGTRALGANRMIFEVTDMVTVKIPHRAGALAKAAEALGAAQVNVNYSYSGFEPGASEAVAVFGVDNLNKAAAALDALG